MCSQPPTDFSPLLRGIWGSAGALKAPHCFLPHCLCSGRLGRLLPIMVWFPRRCDNSLPAIYPWSQ